MRLRCGFAGAHCQGRIDNENVPEDIVTEDKDNLDAINTGPAESAVPEVTETLPATSTPGRTEGNTATGSVDSTPALSKNETPGKTETPEGHSIHRQNRHWGNLRRPSRYHPFKRQQRQRVLGL